MDIRHEPSEGDKVMYNYLFKTGLPFTVIATKADKLPKSQVKNAVRKLAAIFKIGEGNVIPISSVTNSGK